MGMLKKLLWLFVLLASPGLAWAQGSRLDSTAQRTVQNFIAPIPGALITVCPSAGTGTPCTPAVPTNPVTLCTDSSCTVAAPNPFTADANGNWGLWALPGTYKVSITAPGVTGYLLTVVLPAPLSGTNNWTGPNSFSQQITSTVSTGTAPFSIASTTVTPNLNAQFLSGLSAPTSSIVGTLDTQTLSGKTLTSPTINTPTITSATLDGVAAGHAALQVSAATNFGTALGTQTVVSSVPVTGPAIIEFIAIQTLAGVGCSAVGNSAQVTAQFTSPGGTAGSASFTTLSITGNGAVDSGNNATSSFNVVKAGTAITYTTTSTLNSTGCTTTPQYTVFAKAFF